MRGDLPVLGTISGSLLAIGAIASGQLLIQLLGGLALIVAAAVLAQSYQSSDLRFRIRERLGLAPLPQATTSVQPQFPPVTLGERLLPAVFTTATVIIVAAMAIHTGFLVGLW